MSCVLVGLGGVNKDHCLWNEAVYSQKQSPHVSGTRFRRQSYPWMRFVLVGLGAVN